MPRGVVPKDETDLIGPGRGAQTGPTTRSGVDGDVTLQEVHVVGDGLVEGLTQVDVEVPER